MCTEITLGPTDELPVPDQGRRGGRECAMAEYTVHLSDQQCYGSLYRVVRW